MKGTVLIIEDEKGIADTISYALREEGFRTIWVTTGEKGTATLSGPETIDLIILDIGLPDINGFDLLKIIRGQTATPVLILTARANEIDRVLGLELGADDYVVKPFSPRELSARVKAILRRGELKNPCSGESTVFPFTVDEKKFIIHYFGTALSLSRYEFKILALLAGRPGWVFSRDQIMDLIWEEPEESFDRTVDTHIKTIRSKLKLVKPDCDPIQTHRGIGYSLKEYL